MAFLRFTQQWNSIPDFRRCFNWCVGRKNSSPPNCENQAEREEGEESNSDGEKPETKLKTKENGKKHDCTLCNYQYLY